MVLGDEEKKLCANIVDVMNDITGLLKAAGEEMLQYKAVEKIKNIAKSCDPNGLQNIPRYLDGLASALNDNKAFNSAIGRKLEQAYQIAIQLDQSSASAVDDI